jgi:hypothetical protein
MRIFLISVLLLISATVSAQFRDTSDYFTAGVYAGNFQGNGELLAANNYFNSVALEIEYFKFSDLSFSLNVLYQFSNYQFTNIYEDTKSYKLVPSLNLKYYLRNKTISPYIQAGILYEFDTYTIKTKPEYLMGHFIIDDTYARNILYICFGAGLNIKLSNRLSLDCRFIVNPRIYNNDENHMESIGSTAIAGIKYVL